MISLVSTKTQTQRFFYKLDFLITMKNTCNLILVFIWVVTTLKRVNNRFFYLFFLSSHINQTSV